EFQNLKKITGQNLKINKEKTSYLAMVAFKEKLFGPLHPYGRTLSVRDIENLTREDILAFAQKNINYKNCNIIIYGNGDLDFFHLINEQFGSTNWGTLVKSTNAFTVTSQPGKYLIKKEGSLQSSIRVGRELFTISHHDYLKTYFLVEV